MDRWTLVLLLAACTGMPHSDGGDGGGDPGSDGGGLLDGGNSDGATASSGPTRYLPGVLHSPLSPSVVARLDEVLAGSTGRRDVFAKVGDSITVDTNFLHCMSGSNVDLAQFSALAPTRAHFDTTVVDSGNHTSFDRTSLAATVGWTASRALMGNPTPIAQEVDAIQPAFAVVMFGTNDTQPTYVHTFEHNLVGVVDALLARGVVPLVSTIPPRRDSTVANALVPEMNAVIRAVAQARQVPYLDLWQTLLPLPDYGLTPDGVHLQVYVSGGARGCWFTPRALEEGMNQRNLITLTALDRARRLLVDHSASPEAAPPPLAGAGTWNTPLLVDQLPFVDVGDTARSTTRSAAVYSCAPQDEGGPEVVYQVTLDAPATLRARVFVDDGVDVDLHWLDGPTPDRCLLRADRTLDIQAGPGVYYLALDTFVSAGKPLAGPYRLTLVQLN